MSDRDDNNWVPIAAGVVVGAGILALLYKMFFGSSAFSGSTTYKLASKYNAQVNAPPECTCKKQGTSQRAVLVHNAVLDTESKISSAEEQEKRKKLAEAEAARRALGIGEGGGPRRTPRKGLMGVIFGGDEGDELTSTQLLGSAAFSFGVLSFMYWWFDLGSKWRAKWRAIWGEVLDSMCEDYDPRKKPCEGLKINDNKRKWPLKDIPPQPDFDPSS